MASEGSIVARVTLAGDTIPVKDAVVTATTDNGTTNSYFSFYTRYRTVSCTRGHTKALCVGRYKGGPPCGLYCNYKKCSGFRR